MSALREAVSGWAQHAARNAGWLIAFGVLTVITGFVAVMSPLGAGLGISVLLGIAMVVAGVARCVVAFKAGSLGQGALAFIGGILAFVAGLIMVARPGLGLEALTLMLGAYLLADGISGAILAFHVRPAQGWGWMLFSAALGIFLGFLLIAEWPMSGLWAIGTLVGINFLFSGASMVAIGSAARGVAKQVT